MAPVPLVAVTVVPVARKMGAIIRAAVVTVMVPVIAMVVVMIMVVPMMAVISAVMMAIANCVDHSTAGLDGRPE